MNRAPLVELLGICLVMAGCMTSPDHALNMLSTQDEIALGEEIAVQIEQEETILDNADIQAYVNDIGFRLSRVAPRQDIEYAFKVIDAPDTVNAFALPGGHMYIYTGLMRLCENEAELASVMAHEIGHVSARHHGEQMTRQYGLEFLKRIVLGADPKSSYVLVADLIGQAHVTRFSRANEREADELGAEMLFRAGYDSRAMLTFMEKLQDFEQEGSGGNWMPLFASHPPTAERLALLQALTQRHPQELLDKSQLNAERYHARVLSVLE
ncbi:MAG TPA: M48 family metallopeptidase [Candidatus Hydrogenedentes bacterium]|nr:M48 family metallopeptidase [Candidatus Hydrogenedentota bacterium]HPG67406.1 M48 family metallopeptidase [Candidatus Hydrogenedentota bacterium]